MAKLLKQNKTKNHCSFEFGSHKKGITSTFNFISSGSNTPFWSLQVPIFIGTNWNTDTHAYAYLKLNISKREPSFLAGITLSQSELHQWKDREITVAPSNTHAILAIYCFSSRFSKEYLGCTCFSWRIETLKRTQHWGVGSDSTLSLLLAYFWAVFLPPEFISMRNKGTLCFYKETVVISTWHQKSVFSRDACESIRKLIQMPQ